MDRLGRGRQASCGGRSHEVIVVGGGVVGCSIAYHLAKRGQAVTVLERSRIGSEASAAAAGMLGAQSEMEDTGPLFQWARRSRAMFPQLAGELKALTGIDIALVREGLLNVALSDVQEEELRAREKLQRAAGERAEWLCAAKAARLEPALSQAVRGALYLPDDGQVEAPLLAAAFAQAARALGANMQEFAQVLGLLTEQGRAVGVMTSDGPLYSERVVVASGTWSGQLLAAIGVELPVYPVKGECFSVLTPRTLLRKTLFTPGCYIVPKAGGRLLVGATVVPDSYDRKVSLAGLADLMERARLLMPSIGEAEWEKAWTGLRPQTPDGLPYIGKVPEIEGLFAASGHYRNGILLSPITGKVMADLLLGDAQRREAETQLELELEPAIAAGRDNARELEVAPWLDALCPDLSERSKRAGRRTDERVAAEQEPNKEIGEELHFIESAH